MVGNRRVVPTSELLDAFFHCPPTVDPEDIFKSLRDSDEKWYGYQGTGEKGQAGWKDMPCQVDHESTLYDPFVHIAIAVQNSSQLTTHLAKVKNQEKDAPIKGAWVNCANKTPHSGRDDMQRNRPGPDVALFTTTSSVKALLTLIAEFTDILQENIRVGEKRKICEVSPGRLENAQERNYKIGTLLLWLCHSFDPDFVSCPFSDK